MDKTREGDDHSQSFLRVSRLFKETKLTCNIMKTLKIRYIALRKPIFTKNPPKIK